MSLNVYLYREDIPVGMRVVTMNDAFFQKVKLVNDETTRELLKSIDQAEYGNETMFISRNKKMGLINKDYLSTGCKTLLNAYYYPDICFDMLECGRNVKHLMPLLKNGNLFLKDPMLYILSDTNKACDIIYNKKHYNFFDDFIVAIATDRRTCRITEEDIERIFEEESGEE